MVQMKVDCSFTANNSRVLYIPHGSDERLVNHYYNLSRTILYIPHGSDERWGIMIGIVYSLPFISHMVQMKVQSLRKKVEVLCTLYPTWFR